MPAPAIPEPPRAWVLGRVGYDLYSDEPGVALDRVRRFRAGVGGSSANIAVGLARQGWRVGMLAAVSNDAVGRFLMRELASEGVDVSAAQTVDGRNSSLALTEVAPPNGGEQVFYRSQPADAALRWSRSLAATLRSGELFVTNGTSLCAPASRAATRRALQAARAAGMTTVLDVDYRRTSWRSPAQAGAAVRAVWRWVDIVIANEDEMRLLAPAGRASGGSRLPQRVATAAQRAGVSLLVWKRGALGSVAFTADTRVEAPAAQVAVVSTNGAGDAFAAGFLTAHRRGLPLEECLRYGNASAAWVVARISCADAMPTAAELETSRQRLREQEAHAAAAALP